MTATSKVTYDYTKYFQSTWHHGEPITMADVLYGIYQSFDLTYSDEKSQIEFALAVTARPLLDTVKAYRVVDENRIEAYVDYWHFVDDYIAEYAVPSGLSMPWEVLAAMDDLVFTQRRAAYSDTAAGRFSVPWISLVQSRDSRLVDRTLRQFQRDGGYSEAAFQMGGQSFVTPAEARSRLQAAREWFADKNMLVISNGPYQLTRFDPPAQYAELEAFRDPTYPFKPRRLVLRFGGPPHDRVGGGPHHRDRFGRADRSHGRRTGCAWRPVRVRGPRIGPCHQDRNSGRRRRFVRRLAPGGGDRGPGSGPVPTNPDGLQRRAVDRRGTNGDGRGRPAGRRSAAHSPLRRDARRR